MTRSTKIYLKVLTAAAGLVAGMFLIGELGIRYIEAPHPNREMTLLEVMFADAATWVDRWGWLAVPFILGGAFVVALLWAHATGWLMRIAKAVFGILLALACSYFVMLEILVAASEGQLQRSKNIAFFLLAIGVELSLVVLGAWLAVRNLSRRYELRRSRVSHV